MNCTIKGLLFAITAAFCLSAFCISALPAFGQTGPENNLANGVASDPAKGEAPVTGQLPEARIASRQEFREAGFGIFIHWGIYSMLGDGEWVLNDQDINYKEYAKTAGGFYPAGFDAEEWVKTIKAAGAKYICFTSRHHDGFSMFDSEYTDYDIMDATPFGRDIVKELADACHKEGIRLHLYYSLIDWGREDAPRGRTGKGTGRPEPVETPACTGSDKAGNGGTRTGSPEGTTDTASYFGFMKGQITELLSNYGKIGAIWFDGDWDMPEGFDWRYDELYPLIHGLQPGCLIGNNHHKNPIEGEDIQIFERDLPGENEAGYSGAQDVSTVLPLETCQTMGKSWGYDIHDTEYKSAEELIHYLVNAAGRGGNLLLNIGPGPDGRLPVRALDRLRDIGEWMDEFGFTIYGTQRGDILPRDWGATTRKGDTLYVHILDLQDNSLFLPLTGQKVAEAICVNDGKRVRFRQDKDGVLLKLGRIPEETDLIIGLTTRKTIKNK